MAERSRPAASAARFGFTDDRAEEQLCAAGWWGEAGPAEDSLALLAAFSRSPDPDVALRGIERIREADESGWAELATALREEPALRGRLLAVLGSSSVLTDYLVATPGQWRRLSADGTTRQQDYPAEPVSGPSP